MPGAIRKPGGEGVSIVHEYALSFYQHKDELGVGLLGN